MDTKKIIARQTAARQIAEDTNEAVQERLTVWKREGRLAADVYPVMALYEGGVIVVHLDNGSTGLILMDTPDRSTLDGV